MNSHIQQYLTTVASRLKAGTATEHTYRGDLQILIEALAPGVIATNEPKRQACGAPDYILTRNDIPVGYIEAKDITGVNLDKTEKTDQLKRYRNSLENLLLTDYLDFRYFRDGEKVTSVSLAKVEGNSIVPQPENWLQFENLVKDFSQHVSQTIKSAPKLAEMMAGKARLMQTVLENALTADVYAMENEEKTPEASSLYQQFVAFKEVLLHDIKPAEFADIYAQTIAYGMFAARLHDPTLPTFSRMEAAQLIPQTNPFLRKLFQYIAGYDLDQRLAWIVDALADVFRATDVAAILKNFSKKYSSPSGGGQVGADPIIHFYETFLSQYNPALRKSRGVWYTPEPVVNFIVRAVDDILKTEFNLKDGLASTETTEIDVDVQHKKSKGKQTVHKVQVLDPATGTGTFLAEVIKHVHQRFEGQEGIWSQYVEKHLLPRLNGFEILMASYAMCHLKLDLLLNETGYKPQNPRRFKVYLTNSLEEAAPSQLSLFASWLSDEAMQANAVKRDTPVMVVLGNPPYSGESQNKGKWIMDLMEDYKKEPGGKEKLKEKNPKWLNDDYVKFLRFGQHFIEKNGEGILAFINPHGFLDNPTFRGMRWNLLKTYDKIYTLDLHGNSKKKETAPDGSADVNVFDIMQGVSINLFVKTGKKKPNELGQVFHYDLFGKREPKYNFLNENSLESVDFELINLVSPNYYFKQKNWGIEEEYSNGIDIKNLFNVSSIGVQTHRDNLVTDFSNKDLENRITEVFGNSDYALIKRKFEVHESGSWTLENAIKKEQLFNKSEITSLNYRPFDKRFIYYNDSFVDRTRRNAGKHLLRKNYALNFPKIVKVEWNHCLITDCVPTAISLDINGSYFAPLYLYPESNAQTQLSGLEAARTPNLDPKTVGKIAEKLGLTFVPEKTTPNPEKATTPNPSFERRGAIAVPEENPTTNNEQPTTTFAPIDLLDYIYAVLHSPAYRERYKEFLKIDFPRVPYPQNATQFFQLAALGAELRQLHLLEHPAVNKPITKYPVSGNNIVEKPTFKQQVNQEQEPKAPLLTKEGLGVVEYTNHEEKAPHLDRRGSGVVELSKPGGIEKAVSELIESNNEQPATNNQMGNVYINETQYFANVPQTAWEFYIGGYQPAQKWLKDRKSRELQFNDILHYQKIIVALKRTADLMPEIDKVLNLETVGVEG